MPRPLAHLTDEELRALLHTQPPPPEKTTSGMAAVLEWALEFGVFPGRTRAIEATDLHRHFCAAGYRLAGFARPHWEFGVYLNRLGLRKGVRRVEGRQTRPRLLTEDAANYFQAWLLHHPRPADAEPFLARALW